MMPSHEIAAAVEHALAGEWQQAHEIVQKDEDDETACWLHAVLHRQERDLANARYWYRRCGRALDAEVKPEAELLQILERTKTWQRNSKKP